MKQTFKQYLESKEQLMRAIENVPVTIVEYEVRKYCTIVVGEDVDSSTVIQLKPKQKIIVKWIYENPLSPSVDHVKIDTGNMLTEDEHSIFWSSEKLQKWLIRHTREGVNYGHKV
jgi:hypothetical protein